MAAAVDIKVLRHNSVSLCNAYYVVNTVDSSSGNDCDANNLTIKQICCVSVEDLLIPAYQRCPSNDVAWHDR